MAALQILCRGLGLAGKAFDALLLIGLQLTGLYNGGDDKKLPPPQ